MKAFILGIAGAFLSGPAIASPVDNRLEQLEAGKWHPASIGGAAAMSALFAPDFVSVEYGADPMGPANRTSGSKFNPKLVAMLNSMRFQLSEMRALHPSPTVTILSYRITAPAIGWSAFATSVWALRRGKWRTTFYQASRTAA